MKCRQTGSERQRGGLKERQTHKQRDHTMHRIGKIERDRRVSRHASQTWIETYKGRDPCVASIELDFANISNRISNNNNKLNSVWSHHSVFVNLPERKNTDRFENYFHS